MPSSMGMVGYSPLLLQLPGQTARPAVTQGEMPAHAAMITPAAAAGDFCGFARNVEGVISLFSFPNFSQFVPISSSTALHTTAACSNERWLPPHSAALCSRSDGVALSPSFSVLFARWQRADARVKYCVSLCVCTHWCVQACRKKHHCLWGSA